MLGYLVVQHIFHISVCFKHQLLSSCLYKLNYTKPNVVWFSLCISLIVLPLMLDVASMWLRKSKMIMFSTIFYFV